MWSEIIDLNHSATEAFNTGGNVKTTLSLKYRTVIKVLFLYLISGLSEMLDSLSCSFIHISFLTNISSECRRLWRNVFYILLKADWFYPFIYRDANTTVEPDIVGWFPVNVPLFHQSLYILAEFIIKLYYSTHLCLSNY